MHACCYDGYRFQFPLKCEQPGFIIYFILIFGHGGYRDLDPFQFQLPPCLTDAESRENKRRQHATPRLVLQVSASFTIQRIAFLLTLRTMWMNRSRAVSRKKTSSMADHMSQGQANPTATNNNTKACTSLFGHPNFRAFTTKFGLPLSGKETLKSPTSVLDSRPFSLPVNALTLPSQTHGGQNLCQTSTSDATEPRRIGLAIVDLLEREETTNENSSRPCKAQVLFGTQLRVQIPDHAFPLPLPPKSPADFGIKTRNLHVSPNGGGATNSGIQSQAINESAHMAVTAEHDLSMSEMELSEDYTCVICRGPNPKTTRIFDNCILETYCSLPNNNSNSASNSFLSFCYTCHKNLELTEDIFMYRGEKAFCSHACRHHEMLLDGMGHSEFDESLSVDIS